MKKAVIYLHGKGGNPAEALHYQPLFPECDVIGMDYRAGTPWEAAEEFPRFFRAVRESHDSTVLIANSIGAYFAMTALAGESIEKAFFISPIVDMEELILNMMKWACVGEEELRERSEIATDFGEVLSWNYLCWAREHPVRWTVPTHILYGAGDHLTGRESMTSFVRRAGASLTVMENGEHWFHTEEQMRFLDEWITKNR